MKLTRIDWVRLLLLWLGGICLRLTLLAVPPLIPLIHRDLHLDEKGVGALVSLPVLLLALAAVPGSLLIAKFGVRGALVTGLGLVAVFGALRGAGSGTTILFSATFLMGVGIAVSQHLAIGQSECIGITFCVSFTFGQYFAIYFAVCID